jgi:xylulose-5-phosphate/fructose-6-phosphate phosphoketolase
MTVTEELGGVDFEALDAWWRAANYLSVGQIYLLGNPLLSEPLRPEHIKPRLLGHWGTTPGLNLIYAHLNRVIRDRDLDVIYVCGPGHGGPGMVANTYLEGTYTELYPTITQDAAGMARLFRQFSFPGGIPSHAAPETPGSIHEGGELGYSTTRTSLWPASSATGKPRPARWPAAGTPTSSSTRPPTARCCLSCT